MESDPGDKHVAALKAFVLRARRIREHSLAQDPRALAKLQNPQFKVNFTPATGETKVFMELPPEEQVESAAARVRPLLLNKELTYHSKVMNALLFFANTGGAPEPIVQALRALKREWASINPNGMTRRYYSVMIQESEESPVSQLDDGALAFAWIYGDVVHADPERREVGQVFGVEERYRAAVPVVIRLMLLAMHTLQIIEQLDKAAVFGDLGDVFDEEVSVKRTTFDLAGELFVAEYDEAGNLPEPPAFGQKYSEEWRPFGEIFKPPAGS